MIYTPFIWLMLVAAVIQIAAEIYALRFRFEPMFRPFRLVMALGVLCASFYGLAISTIDLPLRILLSHVQFVPAAFLALAVFDLALTYSGHSQWLTRGRLALFLLVPLISIVLELTGNSQSLFRYGFQIDLTGSAPWLLSSKGGFYWLYVAYSSGLILVACGLLIQACWRHSVSFINLLRMLLGILAPLAVDFLFNLGISPVRGYNFAPLMMAFSGLLWGWVLWGYWMFEVVPVARAIVIDHIQDLVIVLDTGGRIIDFNRAAGATLGLTPRILGSRPDALPAD